MCYYREIPRCTLDDVGELLFEQKIALFDILSTILNRKGMKGHKLDITPFFKLMVDKGASDLFFSVGVPPCTKIQGVSSPIGQVPLKSMQMAEIAASVMNDRQRKEFEATME